MSKRYTLTANKTRLYALVKKYIPDVEKMRRTEFIKAPRARSYFLNCNSLFLSHKLYLSVCGGAPLLVDEWKIDDDGTERTGREVHRLTLDELREYGLLEEAQ